jgi:hypothetical protein
MTSSTTTQGVTTMKHSSRRNVLTYTGLDSWGIPVTGVCAPNESVTALVEEKLNDEWVRLIVKRNGVVVDGFDWR